MESLFTFIRETYVMALPKERKVVMNNVLSLSVLQVITYLLPIFVIPYLFRVLGPDKFGLIAFAQAFTQYFIILTNYGFGISATKKICLCHDDCQKISRVFSSVMTIKMALALLGTLLLALIVCFVPRFRMDWPVYVLSFGAVFGSALFPVWFFQGTERMKFITILNIIGGVVPVLLILACVKGPQDYLMVPLINSLGFILTGVLGLCMVLMKFGIRFEFQRTKNIQEQFNAGWNIFISIAAINAYTTTRVFVLGLLTNNNITGFYSIAERIANACQTFPLESFTQAIFPRLSKIYHRNKNKAFQIMRRVQRITVLISLIFLPAIFIFADTIVLVVCGDTYPQAILTLRLLLVSVFFVSANAFRVQFLLVSGRTEIYSRIHVTMAAAGLPLIFILTHYFSYLGAAMATVAIEAGVFAITYIVLKKEVGA